MRKENSRCNDSAKKLCHVNSICAVESTVPRHYLISCALNMNSDHVAMIVPTQQISHVIFFQDFLKSADRAAVTYTFATLSRPSLNRKAKHQT